MVDLELEFCCCWGFLAGGHRIFRITVRAKDTLSALNLGVSPESMRQLVKQIMTYCKYMYIPTCNNTCIILYMNDNNFQISKNS